MAVSSVTSAALYTYRTAATKAAASTEPSVTSSVEKKQVLVVGNDDDFGAYAPGKVSAPASSFTTAAPNGYEQYMPTRAGYSSNNLALAVTDPAAEPFSAGMTKAEVATAARKAIDARYAQMKESGKPFNSNSLEGADWHSAFGDLDRRALNAVATDKTGLFSEEEKGVAKSIMGQQQGLAMGLYSGPIRLAGSFGVGNSLDHMAAGKAGALWLDKVSLDEKTSSFDWAQQRAGTERLYRAGAAETGQEAEDLDSGFSFIEMLLQAYEDWGKLSPDKDITDVPAYQKARDLFDTYVQSTQSTFVPSSSTAPSIGYYV